MCDSVGGEARSWCGLGWDVKTRTPMIFMTCHCHLTRSTRMQSETPSQAVASVDTDQPPLSSTVRAILHSETVLTPFQSM